MDSPLKNMSQKESEWEGEMLKVFREGYQKRSREEDERFLLSAIATAVSNREKEIAEEVEKKELLISHLYNFHYCNCEDSRIYGKE